MNPQIFYIALGAAAFIIILLAVILIALISNRSHSPLSEIQQKLGSLEAAANQMQEIGKEVGSLKSILHAPKLRGNFGEYLLYNLLKDTLPPKNFATQYQFSDGSAVDAIIRLGKNIIPVDSKFPLESFERYLASSDSESKKKAKTEFI
ncbi:MAG: DNA recombination protein RmuC, partial [Treponema sp.]|nr:DNA recombination protein RmuC [Treponema sp.]